MINSIGKPRKVPIPELDGLVARHFRATQSSPLSVSGRHMPLIYLLVATLIAAPHNKAVVVIDVDGKFDVTRVLQCTPYFTTEQSGFTFSSDEPARDGSRPNSPGRPQLPRVTIKDLKHIHIYRPARGSLSHIREIVTSAEHYMIYGRHTSTTREWWGTVVIGGGSPVVLQSALGPVAGSGSADVTTGWKGWLRVDREEVSGFGVGMSVQEALSDRDRRHAAVKEAGWAAGCVWGTFAFQGAEKGGLAGAKGGGS